MVKGLALVCKNDSNNLTKGKAYRVVEPHDYGYIVLDNNKRKKLVAFYQIGRDFRVTSLQNKKNNLFWEAMAWRGLH